MVRKKRKKVLGLLLASIVFLSVFGMSAPVAAKANGEPVTLNVALYGYVPDVSRFENAVTTKWKELEPDVKLNFVEWDCYESDPTDKIDVFVFDALYLQHYVEKGYLLEMPVKKMENKSDILSFALDGCTVGNKVYAVPQILCTNLLYYRNGDTELENVNTVKELYNVIGDRKTQSVIPDKNEGLLIDLSGGTTKVCYYLDGLIDHNQKYTPYADLPPADAFNDEVVEHLKMLQSMAGKEQAKYWPDDNDSYIRAKWFQQGSGRAYIGYTEAMSNMKDFVDDIDFKVISYCKESNIPLFYGDVVGINAKIASDKKELAYKLTNLITATETMKMAISPDKSNADPQYLLPARKSVYEEMGKSYPVYKELYSIVNNSKNKLFLLGPSANEWLEEAKTNLKKLLN